MRTKLKKSLLEKVALEQHEHVRLKPTNALEASGPSGSLGEGSDKRN